MDIKMTNMTERMKEDFNNDLLLRKQKMSPIVAKCTNSVFYNKHANLENSNIQVKG